MNSLLADDFIITTEDGKTFSKSGFIALNGRAAMCVEISETSEVKICLHGNTAVITGKYHEKVFSRVNLTNTGTVLRIFG